MTTDSKAAYLVRTGPVKHLPDGDHYLTRCGIGLASTGLRLPADLPGLESLLLCERCADHDEGQA